MAKAGASNGARAGSGDTAGPGGGGGGGPDAGYIAKLSSLLRSNTTYQVPGDLQGNPKASFVVTVGADCTITSVKLRRSSGVPAWDAAAQRGIERTSPLPRQSDGSCPKEIEIVRGPRDEQR
jgi:colicin import membrane protein